MKNINTPLPNRKVDISSNSKRSIGLPENGWTAARCQRLLRTLTSRIAILRKENIRYSNKNISSENTLQQDIDGITKLNFKPKKKLSRTYGKSGRRQHTFTTGSRALVHIKDKKITPGEVLVPTPLLARVRATRHEERQCRQEMSSSNKSKAHCKERQPKLPELPLRLRQNITTSKYNTYKGIYHGLETILRATSHAKRAANSKGPKTLLELALRVIPRYVADQEKLLQIHMHETNSKSALDDRDVSAEIYNELEELSSNGKGWRLLSYVVRAHGVQVVSDAVKEGLLEFDFCDTLISLCCHLDAIEEAQIILSSLLTSNTYPRPKTPCESPAKPLSLLLKFSKRTTRTSYLYRELDHLISENTLHLEWLGTDYFGPVWTGLIQSLSFEPTENEALPFIDSALHLFLKSSDSSPIYNTNESKNQDDYSLQNIVSVALKNTFSSLLIILISIILLHRGAEVRSPTKDKNSVYAGVGHIISLFKSCISYSPARIDKSLYHVFFLIACLIIGKEHIQNGSDTLNLESLLCCLENTRNGISIRAQLAFFICEVARCCGRGTAGSGFDYLRLIHHRLEKLAPVGESYKLLNGIILDSAYAFARNYPHRLHVKYANSMGASYCTTSHQLVANLVPDSQHLKVSNLCGLKWEEGIGEWVTSTPRITKLKRRSSLLSADLKNQSSSYQLPKRHRTLRNSLSTQISVSDCVKGTGNLLGSESFHPKCSDRISSNIFHLPMENNIRLKIIRTPLKEIKYHGVVKQSFPANINQYSSRTGKLFQTPAIEVESKAPKLSKNAGDHTCSPTVAKFVSPSPSAKHPENHDCSTIKHTSEHERDSFKINKQIYLLSSSPCKNSSSRNRTNKKLLDSMGCDEDELSILSTVSLPTSSHPHCSSTQLKKYIFHDSSLEIKPSLYKSVSVDLKRTKRKHAKSKMNTKLRREKGSFRSECRKTYQVDQDSNDSVDELCV